MKWFATFGQGWSLRRNYVEFQAENIDEAYKVMEHQYGANWSNLYTERAFEGQAEKYGLTKVKFGTENVYAPGKAPEQDTPKVGNEPADETSDHRVEDLEITAAGGDIKFDHVVLGDEEGPIAEFAFQADTSNKFEVAGLVNSDKILVGKAPVHPLSKLDAFILAAWIVHFAEKLEGDLNFGDVLNSVEAYDV